MLNPFKPGAPLNLIATCPEELKKVLGDELKAIGAANVQPGYRAVTCTVEPGAFYRCHLWLRTASSISLELASFSIAGFDDLAQRCSRLPWHRLFRSDHGYLIEGIPGDRGDRALGSNQISKAVRMGLETAFRRRRKPVPTVDLKEPKVKIIAFVRQGRVVLSVNTTGKTLHKRGYKNDDHPAPLKETLAAAALRISGYDGTQTFLDPMCGSGTLAIEAAYIALNKAPMIHRKKGQFAFEWLLDFDRDLWRQVQDEARLARLKEPHSPILASDIEPRFVHQARSNALRARVEKHINFDALDFLRLDVSDYEPGILVANLPYGDRLGTTGDLENFYKSIGDTLKQRFQGWKVFLLTSIDAPYNAIGLRPSTKTPLKNGSIDCRLLKFEIFAGRMDEHKMKIKSTVDGQLRTESPLQP